MSTVRMKFELELVIQRCILQSSVPMLSVPVSSYVETSIGGIICENGSTEPAKMIDGHVAWNKRVVTHFTDLEPAVPMIISMSVYRKNIFKQSFSLIGTAHLCVADFISTVNIGPVYSKVHLSMKKNVSVRGYLLLSTSIKVVMAKENPVYLVLATNSNQSNHAIDTSYETKSLESHLRVATQTSKKEMGRTIAQHVAYFNGILVIIFVVLLAGSLIILATELWENTFGRIF